MIAMGVSTISLARAGIYIGSDQDNVSSSRFQPVQDRPGVGGNGFGSAHPGGWNVVFCDGSVRSMSYSIDLQIHKYLGNRKDHQPIDTSKL